MTKIFTIVSGKGGVGKTTTSINLSIALSSYGKNIALIDANLTTPNVGLYLGVPAVPTSLHHVLQGKKKLMDAIYSHKSGIKIVPGDISFSSLNDIDLEMLEDSLLDLEGLVDFVLVDGAAGLGEEASKAISVSDGVIVVTNPEMPAVTDALKALRLVDELRKPVTGVVINKFKQDGFDMTVKEIEKMLEFPVIGAIKDDKNVRESIVMQNAVFLSHPESEASRNYKRLAAKILDVKYEEVKNNVSFVDRLRELFDSFKKLNS